MSTKTRVSRAWDYAHYLSAMKRKNSRGSSLIVTPVLHIEQLDNDQFYSTVLEYTADFRKRTGKNVIATFMTPESPIVAERLYRTGFSPIVYGDRIKKIAESSDPGLHGHYVRTSTGDHVWPMHHAFFDKSVVRNQIATETQWLEYHELLPKSDRLYSGGWWFSGKELRKILVDHGFGWDFSISSSKYNVTSYGDQSMQSYDHSKPYLQIDGMKSAVAVCSIAKRESHLSCVKYLNKALRNCGELAETHVSLYAHDFDLPAKEATRATQALVELGCGFWDRHTDAGGNEPTDG